MPTYAAITSEQALAWYDRFKKRNNTPEKLNAFYRRFSLKTLSYIAPEWNMLKTDEKFVEGVERYFKMEAKACAASWTNSLESLRIAARRRWNNLSTGKTESLQKHQLRMFVLSCTGEEFWGLILTIANKFPDSFQVSSDRFPSCCGCKGWSILSKKTRQGFNLSDSLLKRDLAKKIYNENIYGASGWFFFTVENLTPNSRDIFESFGWKYCFTSGEIDVFFKVCLTETHSNRLKGLKKFPQYVTKPVEFKKFKEGGGRNLIKSVFLNSCRVYSSFHNSECGVRENTFTNKSTEHPFEMIILRDYSSSKQIYHNRTTCEALGFKAVYEGFEPYLNSSHSGTNHWLLPMWRPNPDYLEDR